jgi:hypothetical protein
MVEEQSQRIETDILNWTSFNDTGTNGSVLFTLPKKGILVGDYITLNLSLLKGTATNKMPMNVGILGCLEECSLLYQNECIQTTRFAGQRNRLMNLKDDSDTRNQKHNVEYSAFDGMDVRNGWNGVGDYPGQFFYSHEIVGLDLTSVATGEVNVIELNNADRDPQFDAGATAATTANFRVRLSKLFPILNQIDLPLGLLNGQFTILIRFADDVVGNRCVPSSTWSGATPAVETRHAFVADNLIDPNTCNLVVDYIYYDSVDGEANPYDILEAQINNDAPELVYTDLVNIQIAAPNVTVAPAAGVIDLVRISNRLNVNNQVIRNLLIATSRQVDTSDLTLGGRMNQVYGRYESIASYGLTSNTTLQLLVNNLPIFPNDLNTDSKIYSECCSALGTTLKVNQGGTSFFNQALATGDLFDPRQSYQMSSAISLGGSVGYVLNGFCFGKSTSWSEDALNLEVMSGLCGTDSYMGINLSHTDKNIIGAGTTCGTSPMQLEITRNLTNAVYSPLHIMVWAEAERIMRISNGDIFVSGS